MPFILGQENPSGRVKKADAKPTDKILLTYGAIKRESASVHIIGCRDIKRDQMRNWATRCGAYKDTKTAIEQYIDAEICRLGYGEGYGIGIKDVVKVFPCAQDQSYWDNIDEEPVWLTAYDPNY